MRSMSIRDGLVLAAGMIVLSLALAWAGRAGVLAGDTPTRISMLTTALILAYFGNGIPKALTRGPRALALRRMAGWIFVLAAILSALVWGFAPMALALPVSTAAIGLAVLVTLSACVFSRRPA